MNNKSKIIVLSSFVVVVVGIFIISNIYPKSIFENLENMSENSNKGKEKEEEEVTKPVSNCVSDCVISFDDCTYLNDGTSKCKWSNFFKFNKEKYNESYQQSCDLCTPISDIKYENISTDNNKNLYHFTYKNKKITLKNEEYMDKAGNVKKLPKEKHLPSLKQNEQLSGSELDNLAGGSGGGGDTATTNATTNVTTSENNNLTNKVSNDDIISALSSHIKSTFGNYLNSIVSNHMNNRNVGSNLNTSPHHTIEYTNLDSSLTNLASANSSNRIMNDNPYVQHGSCSNSHGQQMPCPTPYDYRPPLSN